MKVKIPLELSDADKKLLGRKFGKNPSREQVRLWVEELVKRALEIYRRMESSDDPT